MSYANGAGSQTQDLNTFSLLPALSLTQQYLRSKFKVTRLKVQGFEIDQLWAKNGNIGFTNKSVDRLFICQKIGM